MHEPTCLVTEAARLILRCQPSIPIRRAGTRASFKRVSASGNPISASMGTSPSPSLGSAPMPSRTMAISVAQPAVDQTSLPTTSDEVMASCLESIHSLPLAEAEAAKQASAQNWMSIGRRHERPSWLYLTSATRICPTCRNRLVLPWRPRSQQHAWHWCLVVTAVHLPLDQHDRRHRPVQQLLTWKLLRRACMATTKVSRTAWLLNSRKSLASRRGFSGSLSFENVHLKPKCSIHKYEKMLAWVSRCTLSALIDAVDTLAANHTAKCPCPSHLWSVRGICRISFSFLSAPSNWLS